MTEPIRTRRSARVPGFADDAAGTPANTSPPAAELPPDPGCRYVGAGTAQVSLRLNAVLLADYRRLVRELQDAGVATSLTELTQAVLSARPADGEDARRVLRRWRASISEL